MSNSSIGENTTVRLSIIGFVIMVFIGIVTSILSFGIGAIWWGATIQTKMDILLEESRANTGINKTLIEQVNKHETRLSLIEARDCKVKP